MNNSDFYDLIEKEISEIIKENSESEEFKKRDENNKKSYGFLLWFLKNNIDHVVKNVDELTQYIVDGDDDNSCDVIFSNTEKDEKVYYIIQSKWFSKAHYKGGKDIANTYKSCLTDFKMMISHKKKESPTNKKFNTMYKKLKSHVDNNGKVRFLLVAFCVTDPDFRIQELDDYIDSSLVSTQIYDLISMKNTYIDNNLRKYVTNNPLEAIDPINGKVDIGIKEGGELKVVKDKKYIFLLGAEAISKLYKQYGTRLFLKNVRNPLTVQANQKMKESAKAEPEAFFDYNNGITAITSKVYPYYETSTKVSLGGIQIINGAQTVKSIADAYEEADRKQKQAMKKSMTVAMKTIVVEDNEREIQIIKYTNTQTPIEPRDYHSNDAIQEKMYYMLLRHTDIIYERKRGEFSKKKSGNYNIVTNEIMAQAYLAYKLQNPYIARTSPRLIFDENAGYYEKIFNDDLEYRDLYNAYEIYSIIDEKIKELKKETSAEGKHQYKILKDARFYILALTYNIYTDKDNRFNEMYKKACEKKNVVKADMARSILFKAMCEHKKEVIEETLIIACNCLVDYADSISKDTALYTSATSYEKILDYYKR